MLQPTSARFRDLLGRFSVLLRRAATNFDGRRTMRSVIPRFGQRPLPAIKLGLRPVDQHVPRRWLLWVYSVGEDGVPTFTRNSIENLRQIIADERAASPRPPTTPSK